MLKPDLCNAALASATLSPRSAGTATASSVGSVVDVVGVGVVVVGALDGWVVSVGAAVLGAGGAEVVATGAGELSFFPAFRKIR